MTVLNRPAALPTPTDDPPSSDPEPSRTRSLTALLLAVLAGFALAHLAVAAGLLLLAASVTITLAPRLTDSNGHGGVD
ncbi:hypothetical protein [Deinococcus sp.]|uniref:hypothetical protein n=1 Tax=Deinococcus sp. TaxID=47478 RepID=UPI002869C9B4|nr:hypothetical protein [Deinococcus sp.]